MIRKSIGLAVLVGAVIAFVVTSTTGSTTATYDPFNPVPYLYVALAATGQHYVPASNGIPMWAIAALAAAGAGLVVCAAFRLRWRGR